MKCSKCGSEMVIKENSSTKEKFLACGGFPKCKNAKPLGDKKWNRENIQYVIDKFSTDIIKELEIYDAIIKNVFDDNMNDNVSAFCRIKNKYTFEIHWNIQNRFNTLAGILMVLAHEYKHVQQHLKKEMEDYDVAEKWIERKQEQETMKFQYEYINKIIREKVI